MNGWPWRATALAAFAVVAVIPIAALIVESLTSGGTPSLAHLGTVLDDARQWGLFARTLELGAMSAAGALLLGLPMGFLASRTDLPARGAIRALAAAPLFFPPLVHAIAWSEMAPVRGLFGAAAVFALSGFPIVAVLSARTLERIDRRREEAAQLAGGEALRLRLALRAAAPPALVGALCVFVFAVSDFAVPDYLSTIGPKVNVYSDEIFTRWQRLGSSGDAVAASLPLLAVSGVGLLAIARLRRRGAAETAGGDFAPPAAFALGRWKAPALGFVAAVVALSFGAPAARLAWVAGSPARIADAVSQARVDVMHSVLVAVSAAALATAIAFLVADLARSARPAAARALEIAAWIPLAVPATALGVAMIRAWNRDGLAGAVYESPAVVALALAARFFAFPYHAAASGLAPLDRSMDEAARSAGASFGLRLRDIAARLAAPSLATAWLLAYLFSLRELDAIVLIPEGNRSVPFRIYNAIHFNRPEFVAALSLVLAFLAAAPFALYRLFGRRLELGT